MSEEETKETTEIPAFINQPKEVKRRGPRKKVLKPRIPETSRSEVREEKERQPDVDNVTVFRGRDGEILTRKRKHDVDIFDIQPPKGWSYQWCALSVNGNKEILSDTMLGMQENGWRPVPASRYNGRYMPVGHKGPIVRGQQILMERPEEMTKAALLEDQKRANQQITDRDQSLMGGKAGLRAAMQQYGMEMGPRYRGTGGDLKMSIDRGVDIPKPQHKVEE